MDHRTSIHRFLVALVALGLTGKALADPVTLTVRVDQPGAKIEPTLYGLMTEEINYSYDGGLYAELLPNRIMQDSPPPAGRGGGARRGGPPLPENLADYPSPNLVYWSITKADNAEASYALDTENPINNTALKQSIRLESFSTGKRVGIANDGYWGIPVKPNTEYKASFYAKAKSGFIGGLTVAIESKDGKTAFATGTVPAVTTEWKKYTLTLKTGQVQPTADARFVIFATNPGTLWFNLISLMPPTYNNRPNGNRQDIMQLLVDMKPGFLRYPGGNYLEGRGLAERWAWKNTLGPLEERTGHGNSAWRYRASDGMGMLEFLNWCEDMHAEPVLALYSGFSLQGSYVARTPEEVKPFVEEGLDAIEFVTGDASTKWGAERVKLGHPAPFKLTYVEIGNEENLGGAQATYPARFEQFYDAIRAKYPNLKIISAGVRANVLTRKPDVFDDHHYMSIQQSLQLSHAYDNADRTGPKIFVGEWATRVPADGDTCNMAAGAADAAFLTGVERNADIVVMSCYAPLFVNVNPGGRQWPVDLIGYNALGSFGSPSYYVQKMFSTNRGDVVLPAKLDPVPQFQMAAPPPGGRRGGAATAPAGAPQMLSLEGAFATASMENASGDVILKLVNVQDAPQAVSLDIQGAAKVNPNATGWILTGEANAVNTVAEPTKISPKAISISNAAEKFTHELPAHSVTVLRLKTR